MFIASWNPGAFFLFLDLLVDVTEDHILPRIKSTVDSMSALSYQKTRRPLLYYEAFRGHSDNPVLKVL